MIPHPILLFTLGFVIVAFPTFLVVMAAIQALPAKAARTVRRPVRASDAGEARNVSRAPV
jgi:hypothetical protein